MNLFLDTSALVKLYHEEEGSGRIQKMLEDKNLIETCLCDITEIEFESALWKKVRMGELEEAACLEVATGFEGDKKKYQWIGYSETIKNSAKGFLRKYWRDGLRSQDAVQLAAMVEAKARFGSGNITFETADEKLKKICKKEGLVLAL